MGGEKWLWLPPSAVDGVGAATGWCPSPVPPDGISTRLGLIGADARLIGRWLG